MNKVLLLNDLLREFESMTPVKISAIVSREGLIIASLIDLESNEDSIAGLAADITILGERTMKELLNSTVSKLIIDSEEGSIILIPSGTDAILFTLVPNIKNLGVVLYNLGKLAEKIENILK
ncbi:MAG: roadblock/LC7 domain-containing protein [Candidatus Helarchaeota archaeon]